MEYIRDRLGYRLVLREASVSEWVAPKGLLKFTGTIQNVGFGYVVNKKNVYVILKNAATGESFTALTNLDPRDWRPDMDSRAANTAAWQDISFAVNVGQFGDDVSAGEYNIYLKIQDPKELSLNKRCIQFANNGNGWDAELGANLIGSTIVY